MVAFGSSLGVFDISSYDTNGVWTFALLSNPPPASPLAGVLDRLTCCCVFPLGSVAGADDSLAALIVWSFATADQSWESRCLPSSSSSISALSDVFFCFGKSRKGVCFSPPSSL